MTERVAALGRRLANGRRIGGWAVAAVDLLPFGMVVVAAIVRDWRALGLAVVAAGFLSALVRDPRRAALWAAPVPVLVLLVWGLVPAPPAATSGADCGSLLSPPATWRLAEFALVGAVLVVLARLVRSSPHELALRRSTRPVVALAIGGAVMIAVGSLALAPTAAGPFFGDFHLDIWRLDALLPALVFAGSNGVMEELVYRGALRAWLARATGPAGAVVLQAVVFGFAHLGPDYVGPWIPVVSTMIASGLIAGLITVRTRSLVLPILWHIGFDLPLYYYWACRIA